MNIEQSSIKLTNKSLLITYRIGMQSIIHITFNNSCHKSKCASHHLSIILHHNFQMIHSINTSLK